MGGHSLVETWLEKPRLWEPKNFLGLVTQVMRGVVWAVTGGLALSQDPSPGSRSCWFCDLRKPHSSSKAVSSLVKRG